MSKTTNGAALLLIAFLALSSVQCKKDDKEEQKTKTEILTSGQWRITAYTANPGFDWDGDGTKSTDIYGQYAACEKDNYYVFKADNTLEANEGATKCDPADDQTDTGSWAFTDNESKILLEGDSFTIEELTNAVFRIKYSDTDEVLTVTFSR